MKRESGHFDRKRGQGIFVACILVLVTTVVACGGSKWGNHIRQLMDDTKKEATSSDIQKALIPIFSDHNIRDFSGSIILTNQLSKQISSLPIFSDNPTNIVVSYVGSTNLLFILGGGGFGSWGIVVVRPGSNEKPQNQTIIPWEDGVYFLNDYR